ncbi:MAG: hypothetical protein ABTQ32_35010 [Myxococcaceae bacterium]
MDFSVSLNQTLLTQPPPDERVSALIQGAELVSEEGFQEELAIDEPYAGAFLGIDGIELSTRSKLPAGVYQLRLSVAQSQQDWAERMVMFDHMGSGLFVLPFTVGSNVPCLAGLVLCEADNMSFDVNVQFSTPVEIFPAAQLEQKISVELDGVPVQCSSRASSGQLGGLSIEIRCTGQAAGKGVLVKVKVDGLERTGLRTCHPSLTPSVSFASSSDTCRRVP